MLTHRWQALGESEYPWEQDALLYLRERLPDQEPIRAWANVEFLSLDGRMNEVDLIVLTAKGLFLVEIKSRPGEVTGDQQRWHWKDGTSQFDVDNPLKLANIKSKRLADLLAHQKVVGTARLPFIEPLIFCSAPGIKLKLPSPLDQRVFGREPRDGGVGMVPGIFSALTDRDVGPSSRVGVDATMARIVSKAMEQAGLRASAKAQQVGDYKLGVLLGEGPNYQDYQAEHVALHARRRVRLYPIPLKAPADLRQIIVRAAQREFQILEGVHHPGIVRADEYRETERGPALVFPHDPQAVRLDLFLERNTSRLDESLRLHLIRSIAEVIGYAHGRRLFHRALSPQSIVVTNPDAAGPGIAVLNWQAGARSSGTTLSSSYSGTLHLDELIDDASQVYVAPEARLASDQYEAALDVFSLGAITYHIFTGAPPADSLIGLQDKLRAQGGLIVSDRLNGAPPALLDLVKGATAPQVTSRFGTVDEFLEYLELVEDDLTRPEPVAEVNPLDAKRDDLLAGGLKLIKRLGKGSTAVALLVERDGREYVLKVASSPEFNERLSAEAEVLRALGRHQHIVSLHLEMTTAGLVALLLDKAGDITLARRLHDDGPLHLDWLQRFGEDLLSAVDWLEQQGISHRDIKPENIGVTPIGKGDRQHLLLFDFSLAREAPENIRSGTARYLDPFLKLRKPPRWDLYAERFAAAVTLYEMATARLPVWGDGASDPAYAEGEAILESELFDPALRDPLTEFFRKALARDTKARFDNAQQMLDEWRRVFLTAGKSAPAVDVPARDETMAAVFKAALATATLDMPLAQLGLSTRALNALERLGCTTARQLVEQSLAFVWRLPGVGHKTRREIATVAADLKARFPSVPASLPQKDDEGVGASASIDTLAIRLLPKKVSGGKGEERILTWWLSLDSNRDPSDPTTWPSQTDVAKRAGLTRARVSQVVLKARERWRRDALFTRLRADLLEIMRVQGGVMSAPEIATALLTVRGSARDEPARTLHASAVVRAAIEIELAQESPRLAVRRGGRTMIVASSEQLADWAEMLGPVADGIADRDPLASPETALAALRQVDPPTDAPPLSDSRLLRIAAAASSHAVVSSRDELYPRGMAAVRALRLSQNLFASRKDLTLDQLRERVTSRYPEAEPPPPRPELDRLLDDAGFDVEWSAEAAEGHGAYRARERYRIPVPSISSTLSRHSTRVGEPLIVPDGEVLDARAFEERMRYAATNGQFIALMASPRDLGRAERELARFGAEAVSMDALLIRAMKDVAARERAAWDVVVRADAAPEKSADWRNLQSVVRQAMPRVEAALSEPSKVLLVTNLGLLARYGQLGVFDELRNKVGRPNGPKGLWLLVPGTDLTQMPTVDGVPIPVLTRAQWARIPEPWLRNVHRAA